MTFLFINKTKDILIHRPHSMESFNLNISYIDEIK